MYDYDFVKSEVDKVDKLISKTYKNTKQLLEIECGKCNQIYFKNFYYYLLGKRHYKCPSLSKPPPPTVHCNQCNTQFVEKWRNKQTFCSVKCSNDFRTGKTKYLEPKPPKYCLICKKLFNINSKMSRKNKITCSKECNNIYYQSSPKKEKQRINGKKGGIVSASVQVRRSKAEIYFSELCINYFGKDDVLTNERYFKDKNGNLWDADIIIQSIKTAVLYNGVWHYQQVRKSHNLNQVQARDKLKQNIINDNGFEYYIVKDMGRFDEAFINEQFNLFIHKLKFKNCLKNILVKI